MHGHFSSAINNEVDNDFINAIPQLDTRVWPPISIVEIKDMLSLMYLQLLSSGPR